MHSFSFFLTLLSGSLTHALATNFTRNGTSGYWLENIKHQGLAPFTNSSDYQVFRNVKDFGAKGDGSTDDTHAINLAISSGGRCGPITCNSTTTTPAVVYFPSGTYLLSSSIIDYYYTQIIGDPTNLPILKAKSNFSNSSFGLIDGDEYGDNGLAWEAPNVFFRQIRNFIIDMTSLSPSTGFTGIHWPTSQATSLQNIVFKMSEAAGTQHQGLYIESGSGGFMNDLVFEGGQYGAVFGNQQFTTRNLTFHNAKVAINQQWDWGWTYSGVVIDNCSVGLNMSSGGTSDQSVGSVTFIDSNITNTPIGFISAHNASSPAGSLILENVLLNNVGVAVQGLNSSTSLAGTNGTNGTKTISGWGQGHSYAPNGPSHFQGVISPSRPESLLAGKSFYHRSKPQYEDMPVSQFISVRDVGASGDGQQDDTKFVQGVITQAAKQNKTAFFDAGIYKVTGTIYIPSGSKIVGEAYPVIMGSGPFFSVLSTPQPVVQVGKPGENGSIEWSDMIVSTQGPTQGAIVIEYNLAAPASAPAGMWDVHVRIGGFAGSDLQVAQCEKTPELLGVVNPACMAAFMSMHITKGAAGLYMENNWIWVADHDLEDQQATQITIYVGRGLYVESEAGSIWLVGTGVEHHQMYQYQFGNTKDVFMGQIQTETAYYQPYPDARLPFPQNTAYNDPDFAVSCLKLPVGTHCDGWGLRIMDSENILTYGAGMYSFFNNYNTSCSAVGNGENCQNQIFSLEGSAKNVNIYNLNIIGATNMITRDAGQFNGSNVATYAENPSLFPGTIAMFKSN